MVATRRQKWLKGDKFRRPLQYIKDGTGRGGQIQNIF